MIDDVWVWPTVYAPDGELVDRPDLDRAVTGRLPRSRDDLRKRIEAPIAEMAGKLETRVANYQTALPESRLSDSDVQDSELAVVAADLTTVRLTR